MMKKENKIAKLSIRYTYLVISMALFFSKISAATYFSPSIIVGTNINKIYGADKYSKSDFTDYSYPIGFVFGISNENKICQNLYISNDLCFENRKSKMFFRPAASVLWPYLKYNANYITLSSSLGLTITNIVDVLVGIDMGRLINYRIDVYDHDGSSIEKFKVGNFPNYDISLCLGIKKDISVRKQTYSITLKYLYGLKKYKLCSKRVGCLPNPTKNYGFQLNFGHALNFF